MTTFSSEGAQFHRLLANPDLVFQVIEQFRWHAFGQVNCTVIIIQFDLSDIAAFNVGFVGNGADDIAGRNTVILADFHAVGGHLKLAELVALLAFVGGSFLAFLTAVTG